MDLGVEPPPYKALLNNPLGAVVVNVYDVSGCDILYFLILSI